MENAKKAHSETVNSQGANDDTFSTENITPQILSKVFAWSPTHRNKIERHLRVNLKGIWAAEKTDEHSFYAKVLQMLKSDESVRFLRLMSTLDNSQPKRKRNTFSLYGRLFFLAHRVIKEIDASIINELFVKASGQDPEMKPLEFLEQRDHSEFMLVYKFIISAEDKIEATVYDTKSRDFGDCFPKYQFENQLEDIANIKQELETIIQQLALGNEVELQETTEKIQELRKKGNELRLSVLEVAEQYDFNKEPWTDWEEYEAYCEELEDFVATKLDNDQKVLSQYLNELISFVREIKVQHRSIRTRKKFEESLLKIASELESHRESDSISFLPGPRYPAAWFDWSFNLKGKELEDLQNSLEYHYPELSAFIGDCSRDWLYWGDSINSDESPISGDSPESIPGLDHNFPAGKNASTEVNEEHLTPEKVPPAGAEVPEKAQDEATVIEDNETTDEPQPHCSTPQDQQATSSNSKDHFATFLKNGEFHKAYWIANSCDVGVSAELVGAVALGSQVGAGTSLPAQLQTFFSKLVTESDGFRDLPSKLLLFSAISGSAVFVEPSANEVYTLIEMTNCGINPVDDLAQYIKSEFIYKRDIIRPADIDSALGNESNEQELQRLKEKSIEERERNNSAEFIDYAPARIFLRHLYREGSDLVTIHQAVEHNEVHRKNEIKAQLRQISPEELIASAHTIGLKKCAAPITGIARNQLIRRINETLAIAREWHGIVAGFTPRADGAEKAQVMISLRQHLKKAIESLVGLSHKNVAKEIASVPLQCFGAIIDTLDGKSRQQILSLNEVLISIESIELDDDFEPSTHAKKVLAECVAQAEKLILFPEQLFDTLLARREFLRAKTLFEKFQPGEAYKDRLEQALEKERHQIDAHISRLLNRVEDAYLLGQLDHKVFEDQGCEEEDKPSQEALRSRLVGSLNDISSRLHPQSENNTNSWRIREIENSVDVIEAQMSRMEQKHNAELNEVFNKILTQFPDSTDGQQDREYVREAFKNAIDQGDNIAAGELINRAKEAIQNKTSLPRTSLDESSELLTFIQQIENYQSMLGAKKMLGSHIEKIKNRSNLGEIHFSSFDKAHLREVVAGLTAWNKLLTLNINNKKARNELIQEIGNVLDFLGLGVDRQTLQVDSSSTEDFVYFTANMHFPIDCCPIPTFGSAMGSTVHVVLSVNKKEPEQLDTFLSRHKLQHKPVILIYLQEMGLNLRRKYQQYCAKRKLSILLIDLCLAFHLCGKRNRLPVLFKIAVPFSWAQPYLMKGENVPSETFVGRDAEVKSIHDPHGACIIFGGRQLGKSALLRHFYEKYNDHSKNRYVVYLDIDVLGMPPQTHDQMQAEFWKKINQELIREEFLVGREISNRKGPKKIEDDVAVDILSVLRDNPERELYILLDETDSFLDMDSSLNFPIVRRFRALMAETGRRFKIVLAGLQSVQRYRNWKNHPFAQLGTAIVVRPLSPMSAQKLILGPLLALGFVFEEKSLILRILSQANYHPGLIQIFCYRLLENLYARWSNKQANEIQRTIGLDDLQAIERNPEFVEDIRNRFDWTLDLDDRYKVLIYALILKINPTATRMEREFMTISREWWPQVFEKMDQQALRAVLDELEGLGILIREDEGHTRRYRLRSPNLLRLLGTHRQIEDELLRITSKDTPTTLNPRNFHPKIAEKPYLFGPLTKEQEGQIANVLDASPFGLTIVTGSIALGLDDVARQFRAIISELKDWKEQVIPVQNSAVPEKAVEFIKDKMKLRSRNNLCMIVDLALLPREFQTSSILKQLLEQVGHVCTKNSRGHVLALLPPERCWQWLNDSKREPLLQDQKVNTIELKRWSNGAITNALENAGIQAGAKHLGEEIFRHTLGWHKLIIAGMEVLPSGASGKGKIEIAEIWRHQRDNIYKNFNESPQSFLKDYGLLTDNPQLNKVVNKIFRWSTTDKKMLIGPEIIELVQEETSDSTALLADGGRRVLEWLRIQDVIYPSGSNHWQINEIVGEIMQYEISQ